MRTLEEKVDYNSKRDNWFARGYVRGVRDYLGYGKLTSEGKEQFKKVLDVTKRNAQLGDDYSKGIMCGVRDAARERKAKNSTH